MRGYWRHKINRRVKAGVREGKAHLDCPAHGLRQHFHLACHLATACLNKSLTTLPGLRQDLAGLQRRSHPEPAVHHKWNCGSPGLEVDTAMEAAWWISDEVHLGLAQLHIKRANISASIVQQPWGSFCRNACTSYARSPHQVAPFAHVRHTDIDSTRHALRWPQDQLQG